MLKSAVFFDFFGTLASFPESLFVGQRSQTWDLLRKCGYEIKLENFERNWEDCYNRMVDESNVNYVESHFFDFVRTFLDENFPSKSHTFRLEKRIAEKFLWEWNRGVKLYVETRQVLHQLSRKYKLGIISNTHYSGLVYQNLAKWRFNNVFDAIVTSVEFGIKKPNHRIFEHAASQLSVETGDCVYVGDSPKEDYEGAVGAGMEAILIDRNGNYHNFIGNRIEKLTELSLRLTKESMRK